MTIEEDRGRNKIRVLLVDDQAVVRRGLSVFLMVYDDMEFVGEAGSGKEAVWACAEFHPEVVLMDLVMPEMDGVAAIREIRLRWPHIQVVAITNFKEDDLVKEALNAGALGYLLKNVTADELAAAIRSAADGIPTLAAEAVQALIRVNRAEFPTVNIELTAREKEVLALMILGLSNLQIADRLVVSRSTIKFHVSSVLAKLGAATRTEAVAIALRNRLVEQPRVTMRGKGN